MTSISRERIDYVAEAMRQSAAYVGNGPTWEKLRKLAEAALEADDALRVERAVEDDVAIVDGPGGEG